jgi:chemotaxis protein histidine kinase CheA
MLNESLLNFEVNSDKLPYEMDLLTPGRVIKSLETTWSALQDSSGNVRKILVTLHDVSEQKLLKRKAQEQMEQLLMIQELLRITPEKTRQFFATAVTLLEENKQILSAENLDKDNFRILFVNAHTVKGAARSLQFKRLANDIHEAEHSYSVCLKGDGVAVSTMRNEIDLALTSLAEYMRVNRDVLQRVAEETKVTIDRDFLLSHDRILRSFVDSDKVSVEDVRKTLRDQSVLLTKLIFESLESIIGEYREMTAKIAKDIGKPNPRLQIQVTDIPVDSTLRTALDNCMIHALRNALDHGIEFPEDRVRKGKPPEGTITIEGVVKEQQLELTLHDDGKGLALGKLREKGKLNGLLQADSTRQEVAELIFQQGVSTAQTISQISGRGVGMDAIRKFLRDLGGDVLVVLGPPLDAQDDFASFSLVLRFPMTAENTKVA